MMTPAHFFGGYMVLQASKKQWSHVTLSKRQIIKLILLGLFFSVGIDLDIFITKGIGGHHKLLTHYPLFWLAATLTLFFLGKYLKKQIIVSVAIIILISSWTHIALDLVGITMGVHLLWPFSMKEFSVTPLQTNFTSEQERLQYILSSPVMLIGDTLVILAGLFKMKFDFKNIYKKGYN